MPSQPDSTEFYQQLGANIKRHRAQRGLSQETLATLIGLTRTSLTNIEKGRQHPQLHLVCEIAAHLQVTITDLLPPAPKVEARLDVRTLAAEQVRHPSELTFIVSALKGGK